jgi:hypothetical protein
MVPLSSTRLEFDVQRFALRRPPDVVSFHHEREELLLPFLLPQPAVIPREAFELVLRDSAPRLPNRDVCAGGLR